jgi:maltose alpha-D-glucosyltransferase/alpha-amylase
MLQRLIANEGDGWKWTTEELERYYENCARTPLPQAAESARDHVGAYLEAAAVLGRRTAELHLALALRRSPKLTHPYSPKVIQLF